MCRYFPELKVRETTTHKSLRHVLWLASHFDQEGDDRFIIYGKSTHVGGIACTKLVGEGSRRRLSSFMSVAQGIQGSSGKV